MRPIFDKTQRGATHVPPTRKAKRYTPPKFTTKSQCEIAVRINRISVMQDVIDWLKDMYPDLSPSMAVKQYLMAGWRASLANKR